MNGFLLDTNVVSELRKKERCAPKVNAWAATVPRNQDFLSVLVVGELMRGAILKRRADPQMADALEKWIAARAFICRAYLAGHTGSRPGVGPAKCSAADSAGRRSAGGDRPRAPADLRHPEREKRRGPRSIAAQSMELVFAGYAFL